MHTSSRCVTRLISAGIGTASRPKLVLFVLCLISFLAITSSVKAQRTRDLGRLGSVFGQVVPALGERQLPQSFWVVMRGSFGQEERQLLSSHDPRFRFGRLFPPPCTLSVEAEGYEPSTIDMSAYDGGFVDIQAGPARTDHELPRMSPTVDVESLQTPRKAIKEIEKAKRSLQQGKKDDVASHLVAAARLGPRSYAVQNEIGVLYLRLERHGEAQSAFERAIELKPTGSEAQANLGIIFLLTGRTAAAIEQFHNSLELNPDSTTTQKLLDLALKEH